MRTSSSGLVLRMASASFVSLPSAPAFSERKARYRIRCLVVSVLPAPDSPDMTNEAAAITKTHEVRNPTPSSRTFWMQ